jgi:hypothetical protein
VNIDINTDKIKEDLREGSEYILEQGGDKIQGILDKRRSDGADERADPNPVKPGTDGLPLLPGRTSKEETRTRPVRVPATPFMTP